MTFEIDSKEPFLIKVRYFTDIFCAVKKKEERKNNTFFHVSDYCDLYYYLAARGIGDAAAKLCKTF